MPTSGKLPSLYQDFIHLSRYARWLDDAKRRESWEETVGRYLDFMCDVQCKGKVPKEHKEELRKALLHLEVMPSMRCMMTAGKALEIDNVAGFNCSYVSIEDIASFSEILYILMCGTGVGFSVERQFIAALPIIADKLRPSRTVIKVEDSRLGWADAYRELISMLYQGRIPEWDVSEVRPAGARLKTFVGRASGPEPLVDLFRFTIETFEGAAARRLNSIECHDLCCKIGEVVVSGGVRRSALISLSNPSDDRMRYAKSGNWNEVTPWRQMSNNSACYTEKPGMDVFIREWLSLYESKSGERGIFNREAAKKLAARYGRREPNQEFGCNPCSEIILRSSQFCNLSEVIVRPGDGVKELKRKVELATMMGTMQATLTNFRYLRPLWKKNTEEEALLGVSLTGIMDNELTSGRQGKKELKEALELLREHAVKTNKEWAGKLGINPSVAITCVKPSGTVSQLVDCASGIHARFSKYFVRRVRADKKDPMAKMMKQVGFPCEDDLYKPEHQWVFSFPMKSPQGAITAGEMGAIDQLELWKMYQQHWCEHKPSCTIYIHENEWMDVGAWVYRNFDVVSGISFLPYSSHGYKQPPYQECTDAEYNKMIEVMPKTVDWSKLKDFEDDDSAVNHKEYACAGNGSCELVDLTK
jgi:ribonucleoside-diphosphate reductase alpha chain